MARQERFKYDLRKYIEGIDYNSVYAAYLNEVKDLGFSLYSLSVAVGLNHHTLDYVSKNLFQKPLSYKYIMEVSILTGYWFDLSRYQHLIISKDDLLKILEQKQPTKRRKK